MALAGGGSRKRKSARRTPTTASGVVRAREAFERARMPGGRKIAKGKTETVGSFTGAEGETYVHPVKVHKPHKGGCGCVYFVAEARGPGVNRNGQRKSLPDRIQDKPFEVTSLCQGGRRWTGRRSYERLSDAQRAAKDLAVHSRKQCR